MICLFHVSGAPAFGPTLLWALHALFLLSPPAREPGSRGKFLPQPLSEGYTIDNLADSKVGYYQFTCPVVDFAQYFSNSEDHQKYVKRNLFFLYLIKTFFSVFFYFFNHRTTHSPWPKWAGVIHGDKIAYVFGDPFRQRLKPGYTEKEKELSTMVMRYWANFAKNG